MPVIVSLIGTLWMSDQASLIKTVGARAFYCIVLVMLGTSLSMKDRQTDRPTDRRKREEQKKVKRKRVKEEPLSEEAPRHQYSSS